MKKVFAAFLSVLAFGVLKANPDVKRYEDHLNQMKTLTGQFVQESGGHTATGTIHMYRPGKMRLDYAPPAKLLIISDGEWVMTYDKELDERNYMSFDNTPAALILKPNVSFNDDAVSMTGLTRKGDVTEIALVRNEDPEGGVITLVFQESPLALKEWSIADAQGVETKVYLRDIKTNGPLSEGLFTFKKPNWAQQVF